MRLSDILRRWRLGQAALVAATVTLASQASIAATVSWQSWTFDQQISGSYDGLSLSNVRFQGRLLMKKLSFPVMRVFYDNDACGPYADRLGGTVYAIPWANNAKLAQREFTLGGQQWYEIGIRDKIGSYDIYQVYYLSADGMIDAHIYSKGLQCVVNHIHYPNWRVDFDLDGAASDQILRDDGSGYQLMAEEFDANAASARDHAWRVRDAVTGLTVDVRPGFPDFSIPDNTTLPVTVYNNNTVFGRRYLSTENKGWTYGPNTQVPFNNGESIDSADVVLWYEGYLPHSSAEGSALWHSTGVRLVTNLAGTPPPPPPPPPLPGNGTQSFAGGPVSILDKQGGAPYPSTVSVAAMGGIIAKVTVKLDGLSHTYPDDLDIGLIGPGGQRVLLMSDAGGGHDVNGVALTFDSTATGTLSSTAQIAGGVFRPVNYGSGDSLPAPAPSGTYEANLAIFNGLNPNGTWRLYVADDAAADVGSIANGWVLTITTQ